MKKYEVKIKYSETNGYTTSFEAELIEPNQDDIVGVAIDLGKVSPNDIRFVEYAREIK